MTKQEYLESQRGKSYSDIVKNQPMETVVGTIRGDNLRDVVAILASGLQYRLDTKVLPEEAEPLRTALLVAFKHLGLPEYGINLALPENKQMLESAVAVGLVDKKEADRFIELASYERPLLNVTREDCAEYFNPGWHELPATHDRGFTVDLLEDLPESTTVVVQYKEIYPDRESAWRHATSLNVHQQGKYRADTPYNGYERRFQWRCEYALVGSVAVL